MEAKPLPSPGPELDALVAHHVYGHQVLLADGRPTSLYFGGDTEPLPAYSSDPAHLLSVVTRMRQNGFWFTASLPPAEASLPSYARVSFICSRGPCERHGSFQQRAHGAFEVEGVSFTHAAALAAVIAKGGLPHPKEL